MRPWLPLACVVLLSGCGRHPSNRLLDRVPRLDPELAQELLPAVETIDPLSDAAIYLDIQMAQAMDEDSLYTRELGYYRHGLFRARARGSTPFLPVMLMHVGFVLGKVAHSDSTWIYYEQARELAEQMRWSNAVIRAMRLMAGWQRAQGHLAWACELAMESQGAAREFRGGPDAWYGLRTALDVNLDLGAWNVVADLVARGEAINRRWPPEITNRHHDTRVEDIRWFRARLAIARGDLAEGNRLFREIREPVRQRSGRQQYAFLLLDWGRALLEAGEPAQALPLLREGCDYCREKNLPAEQRIRVISVYADALVRRGEFDAADSGQGLRGEMSRRPRAMATTVRSCRTHSSASPGGSGEARAPAEPAFGTDGSAPVELARRARRFRKELGDRGARHLLYMVGAESTVRWAADGNGVRRVVPGIRASGPAGRSGPAPAPPGGVGGRSFGEDLRESGPLPAGVPFEALNVSPGAGYEALLARRDVVYLNVHGGPRRRPRAGDAGIILADPAASPELRRRYPVLGDLPNTLAEGEQIRAASPNSVLLSGPAATKAALTRDWEKVSFLCLAAHFVRDAEVPYLLYLPLAPATPRSRDGETFLDMTGIRKADLSGCALVVLSGCATGAPYSDLERWGPSLGDAFLDAGAHAVIQTFWPVEDLSSRRLMTDWTARWKNGTTPARALCETRRAILKRGGAAGHPHFWAAYSIEVGGI